MVVSPTSTINFYNWPFDKDYQNVVFSTGATFDSILSSRLVSTLNQSNYTYLGKNGNGLDVIRVEKSKDSLANVNYISYRNANFSNMYFYAFLDSIDYVNEATSQLNIRTDVWSTWIAGNGEGQRVAFDTCFIERETVLVDTPGLHTIEEDLETGDMIPASMDEPIIPGDLAICVAFNAEWGGGDTFNAVGGGNVYDIYSGCRIRVWKSSSYAKVNEFLKPYIDKGHENNIISVYMILASSLPFGWVDGFDMNSTGMGDGSRGATISFTRSSIGGYNVKNKKCLCYPYRYVLIHTPAGSAIKVKFENQQKWGDVYVNIVPNNMPNPVYYLYVNSENEYGSKDIGLTLGGFPMCSWNSNSYKSWLANNQGSLMAQASSTLAGSALGLVGSIASGNVLGMAGAALSAATSVGSMMGTKHDRSRQTSQFQGTLAGGAAMAARGDHTFYYQLYECKREYIELIDNYFNAFGYRVNRFAIPTMWNRKKFDYVKTLNAIAKGNAAKDDLREIESILNKGVTLWHSFSGSFDTTISNPTVS